MNKIAKNYIVDQKSQNRINDTNLPVGYMNKVIEYLNITSESEYLFNNILSSTLFEYYLGAKLFRSGCPVDSLDVFRFGRLSMARPEVTQFITFAQHKSFFDKLPKERAADIFVHLHERFEAELNIFIHKGYVESEHTHYQPQTTFLVWDKETEKIRTKLLVNILNLAEKHPDSPIELLFELAE